MVRRESGDGSALAVLVFVRLAVTGFAVVSADVLSVMCVWVGERWRERERCDGERNVGGTERDVCVCEREPQDDFVTVCVSFLACSSLVTSAREAVGSVQ